MLEKNIQQTIRKFVLLEINLFSHKKKNYV